MNNTLIYEHKYFNYFIIHLTSILYNPINKRILPTTSTIIMSYPSIKI